MIMENKTLFQIEQRIKKGCGKCGYICHKCGAKLSEEIMGKKCPNCDEWTYNHIEYIGLCPTCQSNLVLIQEIRGMIEKLFIKEDVILKKVDDKVAYLMISRNISHKEEREELVRLRQEFLGEKE